jgi:endoglucanase
MPGCEHQPQRRRLLSLPLWLLCRRSEGAQPALPAVAASCATANDEDWRRFVTEFVQVDGRVVDRDTEALVSTSEGQAYTLFFALVADDRALFDCVLDWTRHNLAGGDFATRLPAWQWGRQRDGRWGVLDSHPASDADLWLAYCLFEAGRLWQVSAYTEQARAVLRLVVRDEIADVPGLGLMLLPGPVGFVSDDRRTWRFNPSYTPLHLLRALAQADPGGPWSTLAHQHLLLLRDGCPRGLAPDWMTWQLDRAPSTTGHWISDPVQGDLGSYDAIRCYLWAGLLSPQDPLAAEQLRCLQGLRPLLRSAAALPERLHTRSAEPHQGQAPAGFDAALLPYLGALGDTASLQLRLERLQAFGACGIQARYLRYYEHALLLFGSGWLQGRWRFDVHGRLQHRATPHTPRALSREPA